VGCMKKIWRCRKKYSTLGYNRLLLPRVWYGGFSLHPQTFSCTPNNYLFNPNQKYETDFKIRFINFHVFLWNTFQNPFQKTEGQNGNYWEYRRRFGGAGRSPLWYGTVQSINKTCFSFQLVCIRFLNLPLIWGFFLHL